MDLGTDCGVDDKLHARMDDSEDGSGVRGLGLRGRSMDGSVDGSGMYVGLAGCSGLDGSTHV